MDDILAELERAEALAERLSSRVTNSTPLSVNEFRVMAIASSLLASFKPTMTPLLQGLKIVAADVISTVHKGVNCMDLSFPHNLVSQASNSCPAPCRTTLDAPLFI